MKTWKLILAYDGQHYAGWQRQLGVRTIQEVVETVLLRIFGDERIVLHVAGRTDAGVHALGQVCSFRAETVREPGKVRLGLSSLLPRDIACLSIEIVPDRFHARFTAVGKTYRYVIDNRPVRDPFWAGRALHVFRSVDWAAVDRGLADLEGAHDFTSFRGPRCELRNPERVIDSAKRRMVEGRHCLEFSSVHGFLRYQIRIMVGTLLEIGLGKRPDGDIPRVLAARDRAAAGRTALPDGLYLVEVRYPPLATADPEE